MARVLVTGASGLLGRGVADALAARGDEVTTLHRRRSDHPYRQVLGDIGDREVVDRAVAGQQAIVHLAAKVDVTGPWRDFERSNIEGTRWVTESATRHGIQRLVHVSSPSVAHTGGSLIADGAGAPQPAHARSNYARSKAAAELIALQADAPELAVVAIRPHLVWGPGDTQLVARIQDRAASGRLPILGRGTALIDTTYIDNAVTALVAALDRAPQAHGRALVVTNGEPRPVAEMIDAFARAAGVAPPRRRIPPLLARGVGAAVEAATTASRAVPWLPTITEPPLTRFLAEQLSTAHWFDQRETRQILQWSPHVSISQGLDRLGDER